MMDLRKETDGDIVILDDVNILPYIVVLLCPVQCSLLINRHEKEREKEIEFVHV